MDSHFDDIRLALINYHEILRHASPADYCNAEWDKISNALEWLENELESLDDMRARKNEIVKYKCPCCGQDQTDCIACREAQAEQDKFDC